MKKGTASRVFIGGNKVTDDFGGLLVLSQVVLGKKSGMFTDHTGLYVTDNVMLGKGIARVITAVVHGTSPLSLPKAVAGSLSYVKAFGGTEQRNIPNNYIERQFIYMMDGSYLLTDIVPTYDGRIEMDFQTTTLPSESAYFVGGRTQTYGGLFFAKIGSGVCIVDAFGTLSDDRYTSSVSLSNNTRYKFTFNNKVVTLESGGTTLFTNTFTDEDANGADLVINGLNSNGTVSGAQTGIYLYSFKAWNGQGELIADYIPAMQKGTVPVVGFYDTVSKTFKTATAGTFAAGGETVPSPDTPIDIVCNNGVLKWDSVNQEAYTDGTVETITDTLNNIATAEMLLKVGNYQDEQEILSGAVTRNCGVLVLDGTEEIWGTASQTSDTVSVLSNCYTVAIPLGDGPIDKRRVYCTHLNSSDTLPDASARQGYALLGNAGSATPAPLTNKYAVGLGLTTSFPTIASLKQWLAQQYAAGTPVIVIYPLATPTTETVTGQTLQVQAGDNTLEITQASMTGLELEAKYQKVP